MPEQHEVEVQEEKLLFRKVALLTSSLLPFIVLLICDVELLLESNSIDSDGIVWPLWSNLKMGFPPAQFPSL